MTIFFDSVNFDPSNELLAALERVPSNEFANFGSLKGRAVCVWKVLYHTVAITAKPALYTALGLFCLAASALYARYAVKSDFDNRRTGFKLILTALVTPLGQMMQLFKAVMGILYPGCYFRENECSVYFTQLVAITEEVECDSELIEAFQNGPSIIERCLQTSGAPSYYEALFKRDLAIICEKLSDPELSQDEKLAVLNMFASLPNEIDSGIQACGPGLGRLLEQICACLDIPKEPEEVLPWLAVQIKEEILHLMVMRKDYRLRAPDEAAHEGNILIAKLGEKIELPQEMIYKAYQDVSAQDSCLSENQQQELLDLFNQSYTEDFLETYLMKRINSQPDGKPGLKDLRNYMIQKLAEQVSDEEIESSKQAVQDKLGIGEALADDPIFYVKLHYYLYPDADPSDEKASDLNIEGIKAFAATLMTILLIILIVK